MCRSPRRWCVTGLMVWLVVVGVASQEQYPIFTGDHLDATMKTLGPNVAAARASLEAGDHEQAKSQLVRSREQLATTITFWRDRNREDAIGFLRTTLDTLDDLDDALSMSTVDAAAVSALSERLAAGCDSCHAVYREQDQVSGEYSLRSDIE